jgi:cell division protein FtsI (penicillin-binding protein 3)
MNKRYNKIILEESGINLLKVNDKTKLNIRFNRIAFIFFIFFIISLIYSIHLLHLGSRKLVNIENSLDTSISKKLYRADIIDRNGTILVKTVSSIDVGINPKDVIDKKKLIINLKYIFPEKDYSSIKNKLDKKKFFWFEKKISEEKYEKLMKLGDKSIRPEEKIIRLYPQGSLFSHIIGQIDDDNNGISGLEKTLDKKLKKNLTPINLTVDSDIQFLIREELIKFKRIFRAKGAAAILMNVNNGDILSLVSLPDFNLNKRKKITDVNYINKVTKGTYEFGSVFKTFTLAAALNERLIEKDTKFKNLPKSINCGGFPIREYDEKMPSNLTAEQILVRSGNIGSVRIAQMVGAEKFQQFLEKIGILGKINFDIDEIANTKKFIFGKCKLATASFGHGISTTILQLAKGYSIIANGGFDITPKLIKGDKLMKEKKRVLTSDVSERLIKILRKVVSSDIGTANLADVKGYEIAGKTGTAQQPIKGEYSKIKINTFASIFPSSKPKFVLVLMLESPKGSPTYIYNYRNKNGSFKGTPFNTAGWTTVEVAGQILDKIGPILATKYLQAN